ncbi:hypothetical protein GGR57DRAFT_511593 [Xylariaceae sp. FL1272]|nr:hypothetical protein GGR57DRAFT_511593 [Xylariaceae sp. FL1272]
MVRHRKAAAPFHKDKDAKFQHSNTNPPAPPGKKRVPSLYLPDLLPDSIEGGFRWETRGVTNQELCYDGGVFRTYRQLLKFHQCRKVAAYFAHTLKFPERDNVTIYLADIFLEAARRIDEVWDNPPARFFLKIARDEAWSKKVGVTVFWRFVKALIFGRNLYKAFVDLDDQRRCCKNELAFAVDEFVHAFESTCKAPTLRPGEPWELFSQYANYARNKRQQYMAGTDPHEEGDNDVEERRINQYWEWDHYEYKYVLEHPEDYDEEPEYDETLYDENGELIDWAAWADDGYTFDYHSEGF